MSRSATKTFMVALAASGIGLVVGASTTPAQATARRTHAFHHRHASRQPASPQPGEPLVEARPQQGVAGYFGPGAYGPPIGYGYGYGPPRGDLGFALLGALNGGGFRGFVECGNYYARTPGACGF